MGEIESKKDKKFKFIIIAIILFSIGSASLYVYIYSDWGVDYGNYQLSEIRPKAVGNRLTEEIVYTLDAQDDSKWVYFDFSRGSVVKINDPKSLDWDLGFRRLNLRINGGEPNPRAKGAVLNLGKIDFGGITAVPPGEFISDISYDLEENGAIIPQNPVFKKWYQYTHLSHKLWPLGDIYIIRTAEGNYAKMQLLSYYLKGEIAGHFTFRYVYQGDGSKNFVKE